MDTLPPLKGPIREWSRDAKLGVIAICLAGVLVVVAGVWLMMPEDSPAVVQETAVTNDVPPEARAAARAPARLAAVRRPAAAAAALAPKVSLSDVPALEVARAAAEGAGVVNGGAESKLSADFECAFAPNAVKVSDTHFVLDFENKYEWMFLFKLTGVAGKTIRVDCKNVPMAKWATLNPVYRYANDGLPELPAMLPDNYKLSNAKTTKARNGALLPDTTGQAWHWIPEVWAGGGSTLTFVQTFEKDEVTVAMKTPFTLEDEKALVDEARASEVADVIDIGRTPDGRMLHLIKVSSGGQEGEKAHPCILMYAREHADENDSSWVVAGALKRMLANDALAKELRGKFTFLFVPILDIDGAAHTRHENIIKTFGPSNTTPESIAYAVFFQDLARNGTMPALTLNLHNLESQEGQHLECPMMPQDKNAYASVFVAFSNIRSGASACIFSIAPNASKIGVAGDRLGDWLAGTFGTLHLPLEVNSQESHRHLTASELDLLGSVIIRHSSSFFVTKSGIEALGSAMEAETVYKSRWNSFSTTPDDQINLNPFMREARMVERQRNSELLNYMISSKGPTTRK